MLSSFRLTTLITSLVLIFSFSLITLFSFSGNEIVFWKQLGWIIFSLIIMTICARMPYDFLKKSSMTTVLYGIGIVLLIAVLVIGKNIKGAQAWIDFGFFSLQPADVMKFFFIIIMAKYLARRHVQIADMKHIIITFCYMIVPAGLILLQPDFGSVIIFGIIWFFMLLLAGISRKHLLILTGIGILVCIGLWSFVFKPYQKLRIVNFINPSADVRGSGYNVNQSMIAFGSGQLIGKGFGYGTQSRLNFLPEYKTDFIFAAYGEEWGFIGISILLTCFATIVLFCITTAHYAKSNFESLFSLGVALLLLGHITINIGMNMGIMPVTGIPLPFMSYGGTHILIECIMIGIVIAMHRNANASHKHDYYTEFTALSEDLR